MEARVPDLVSQVDLLTRLLLPKDIDEGSMGIQLSYQLVFNFVRRLSIIYQSGFVL